MEKESYTKIITDKFSLITDTHFGRTFKEGVPLNRRGEYENKILDDFGKVLNEDKSRIFIHAGDLFESPYVSNEVLMNVYTKIIWSKKPLTHYYYLAGNHDLPKDDDSIANSSFYILSKLLEKYTNIHFIFEPELVEDDILLIPYSHRYNVNDWLDERLNAKVNYVVGHFEDPVPPTLAYYNGQKFSGHFHKQHITYDGTYFIGSFYPIAFGEESDDSVMETMTLEEYHNRSDEELKDKRVRILLKEGEELPVEHSCLQLIGKKEKKDEINIEVKLEDDFDFRMLFYDCLKNCKKADDLWYRYLELKGTES